MSMMRRCDIWKATDGKWYMFLGRFEHAEEFHECDIFGPFKSKAAVMAELDRHSNPGAFCLDDSGKGSPP